MAIPGNPVADPSCFGTQIHTFAIIFFVVKGMGSCKPKSQSVEHWHFFRWSLLQSHHGARDRVVQICSETPCWALLPWSSVSQTAAATNPSISNHHRMAPINAAKPTFRTTTIKFSQYCRIFPHVLRTHQSNQPSIICISSQLPLLLALQHPCVVLCCVTVSQSSLHTGVWLNKSSSYSSIRDALGNIWKHIKQQTDLKGCRRSRAFKFIVSHSFLSSIPWQSLAPWHPCQTPRWTLRNEMSPKLSWRTCRAVSLGHPTCL